MIFLNLRYTMKVLLFICILSIFLFVYNIREGFVDSPEYILLNDLKKKYFEEKTLEEVIRELNDKKDDNNRKNLKDADLLTKATDTNRKKYEERIAERKAQNVRIEVKKAAIEKLFVDGRITIKMTIGTALCKEITRANTKTSTKTQSTSTKNTSASTSAYTNITSEVIPFDLAAETKKYEGLSKNPSFNPFVYVKLTYPSYSDDVSLSMLVAALKNINKNELSKLIEDKIAAPNSGMTGNTTLINAVKASLGYLAKLPAPYNGQSVLVLLRDDTLYAPDPKIGWTPNHTLDYIVFKLNLIITAQDQIATYIKSLPRTTSGEQTLYNSIVFRVNYVSTFKTQLESKINSGVNAKDSLANAIKANA